MTDLATWGMLALIAIIFLVFLVMDICLSRSNVAIKKLLKSDNILNAINQSNIAALGGKYSKTINIETADGKRTNIPAAEIFNGISICKIRKLNLRILDSASGMLVGLGLLGTFLGLTLGLKNSNISDTAHITESIQGLLDSMKTAFYTSLAGMLASLIFTPLDKVWRHRLYKQIYGLTEKLDELYYIDDIELSNINQQMIAHQLQDAIADKLMYRNADGQDITISNAIREILTESQEQSKALKSFSTDLAIELNNGFDETLSRQMQQKILPLMENVDATTKAIVEHIDQMAAKVSAPAADLMHNVVDELKSSMQSIIHEFTAGLSGSATANLENLAQQLGTATQAMTDFPKNMEESSANLQVSIEEFRHAISEISNTCADANSATMQQMQEQSNQMVSKLADAAEKMGAFLNGTVSTLSTSVQESVKSITDDVSNKQADLIALQEDTTTQTKKLLDAFNAGLDRLEKMNEYISGTMNMFQQAQGQITGSTAHLQTITGNMEQVTQLFSKSQIDYAMKMEETQRNTQQGIESVRELLQNSGELSSDYAAKFEIIRQGLGDVFQQLQKGLTEYSQTVKATTDKYLTEYSTQLTDTTNAISSASQQLNDMVEMLVDSLNAKKNS